MTSINRSLRFFGAIATLLILSTLGFTAGAGDKPNAYTQTNLVSDQPGVVPPPRIDQNLVNAWGLAFNPNAVAWVADNGKGKATLYDGNGNVQPLVVTIPPVPPATQSKPTGIVFNSSGDFDASAFIFSTEDGTIAGWTSGTTAVTKFTARDGAIYKGLAIGGNGNAHFLYATDFHNAKIDVFGTDFKRKRLRCSFFDPRIPRGFAPFGIQNLNGNLYVTYAKQDADREDDVAGQGLGFVNVFDANGCLIRRVATRGQLNAPWGLAIAPADFGKFSNNLLVGNFGDGRINAYDVDNDTFRGQLRRGNGKFLVIDGLWGLAFGNGVRQQPTNVLFFTAGPDDENHGLYGRIKADHP